MLGEQEVCQQDLQFKDATAAYDVIDQVINFVDEIKMMGEVEFENECPASCTQMHFAIQKISKLSHNETYHWTQIKFDDEVEIYEEQSNYTGFSLIVELGSSLGLWVGLSALGLIEVFLGGIRKLSRCLVSAPRKTNT